MKDEGLDYRKAGVDIEAADQTVQLIKPWVNATGRPGVLSELGAFAGFFKIDTKRYPEPVMISGTDGVGTKLKVAQMAGVHHTVGIDLVAMCVNDILVHGAEPLFFLDYLAVGHLVPEKVESIVKGVAQGCKEAGCALIGGETAEMPGFYTIDEYDLAGFAVGVANEDAIITGARVREGDVVIGLPSSGLHSNGYSLVRKVVFDRAGMSLENRVDELGKTVAEELLTPTRIYTRSILQLISQIDVKGMAHITGGGIVDNLRRIIPAGVEAVIQSSSWTPHPVFSWIARLGGVEKEEMFKTFNMGIGFIIVVSPSQVDKALTVLKRLDEQPWIIGEIRKGSGGVVLV
ncbi:MAG: phosphoribosylformylglycinamidine cyclo-ligase [Chitinophagales bacterium]